MEYNHDRIKQNAKIHYDQNKTNSILAALIVVLLTGVITNVGSSIAKPVIKLSVALGEGFSFSTAGMIFAIISGIFAFIIGYAVMAVIGGFSDLITMGGMNWYRRSISEQNLSINVIFDVFTGNFLSNIWTCILRSLYITLWSLLFIVPGIVKTYAYSMTEFVKMEFPDVSASRAIEISEIMTKGHKGQLFYLDMSFIGWFMLSAITLNIVGIIYAYPYYYAARAFAYEELKALASDKVYEFPDNPIRY